jgi:hypothetical protein
LIDELMKLMSARSSALDSPARGARVRVVLRERAAGGANVRHAIRMVRALGLRNPLILRETPP